LEKATADGAERGKMPPHGVTFKMIWKKSELGGKGKENTKKAGGLSELPVYLGENVAELLAERRLPAAGPRAPGKRSGVGGGGLRR